MSFTTRTYLVTPNLNLNLQIGGYRAREILGVSNTLKAFAGSLLIKSNNAIELNYVDKVCSPTTTVSEAKTLLHEYLENAQGSTRVLRGIKKMVSGNELKKFESALYQERELFSEFWGAEENVNALSRFSKRS